MQPDPQKLCPPTELFLSVLFKLSVDHATVASSKLTAVITFMQPQLCLAKWR